MADQLQAEEEKGDVRKSQNMEQYSFTNLPSEIKLQILSRLPIRSAVKYKLVDRSWRSMIECPEFTKSYKSAPCLIVERISKELPRSYKVYEVEDGDENSENSCKEIFNFSFPHFVPPNSSVNGLLFMILLTGEFHDFYVCNPVTREYIHIPRPESVGPFAYYTCGFGVSRKSGQFKVVRIHYRQTPKATDWRASGYNVYTLGTGQWRNAAPNKMSFVSRTTKIGEFHNGNLYWLAFDSKISCFDLETEVFTTLRAPHRGGIFDCSLHVVRDCLGICDCSSKDETVIWLMKDYGDEKSWTKLLVIPKMGRRHQLWLTHVFKDGDILLKSQLAGNETTLCYSNKTKAIEVTNLIELRTFDYVVSFSFTPSLLPLKSFSLTETVNSF